MFALPGTKNCDKKVVKNDLNFLLFTKASYDRNKDKKLTKDDGFILYKMSFDGTKILQLTPNGTDFIDFDIDTENQRIYVRYKKDSNKDNIVDIHDEVQLLTMNYYDDSNIEEIL